MTRPPLNLGAMAASSVEENVERMQNLVETFNKMLGTEVALQDDPNGGCTDCKTFVRVPFMDPEAYLICEHELSHLFGETDLDLTKEFVTKAVERLLNRAKIPITSPDATPYKGKLTKIVQTLWNVLEDWRCCSIWGEIYYGGASLLSQRWKDIAQYQREDEARKDLVPYLMRAAAGFETDGAPPEFKACRPHMDKARAMVELVDNSACLAITARLIDDIADELLRQNPPNSSLNQNSPQQRGLNALAALGSAVAPPSSAPPNPSNKPSEQGIGAPDVLPDQSNKNLVGSRVSAATMRQIRKLMTASDDDPDQDGVTSFQKMVQAGAEKMNERIAAAKAELGKNRKSEKEQSTEQLSGAAVSCGIRATHVTPPFKLPKPSKNAGNVRRYLEQVRLEQERISSASGTRVNVQKIIQAKAAGNLGSMPLFQRKHEVGGMQLLILADVSGSMAGSGLEILDQAIADVEFSCKGLKVDLNLWTFSTDLYFFTKIGSVCSVPGMYMSLTNMVRALDTAIEWQKQGTGDRAVILMTDGLPTHLRGRKSTGSALEDLAAVMKEIRREGVVLSTLAIGAHVELFDKVFGAGRYGLVRNIEDLPAALTNAVKVIIEAHLKS